jgi:hypothetical protein
MLVSIWRTHCLLNPALLVSACEQRSRRWYGAIGSRAEALCDSHVSHVLFVKVLTGNSKYFFSLNVLYFAASSENDEGYYIDNGYRGVDGRGEESLPSKLVRPALKNTRLAATKYD